MKILLMGGYGNVGKFLSELILKNTDFTITLAGRNIEKANEQQRRLSKKFSIDRIKSRQINAAEVDSLINSFQETDFIINSASTVQFTNNIIEALLKTKKDYLDLLLSTSEKVELLKKAEPKFIDNNQKIITDGGFHPGLPAVLINYAAEMFDQLVIANVGSLLNMDWKFELSSPDTIKEFIYEFKKFDSTAFVDKEWKKLRYRDVKYFDFGKPFGKKPCIAMMLEELKSLPKKYPSLTETGFYVSGFDWFTDYIVTPLLLLSGKMCSLEKLSSLIKLFKWSITTFSKTPYKIILQLKAEGKLNQDKKKMLINVSHEDGYYLTAASVFACIHQYFDDNKHEPGLYNQANYVEPKKFLNELNDLGCLLEEKIYF